MSRINDFQSMPTHLLRECIDLFNNSHGNIRQVLEGLSSIPQSNQIRALRFLLIRSRSEPIKVLYKTKHSVKTLLDTLVLVDLCNKTNTSPDFWKHFENQFHSLCENNEKNHCLDYYYSGIFAYLYHYDINTTGDRVQQMDLRCFSEDSYQFSYPDTVNEAAIKHFLAHGRSEGRAAYGVRPGLARSSYLPRLHRPGINYYGMFTTTSGMGIAARECAKLLLQQGIPISLIDITSRELNQRKKQSCIKPGEYDINLFHINADMTFNYLDNMDLVDGYYNIGYWAWELSSFRPEWISAFDVFDEIWTISTFCRDSIQDRTNKPVKIVHHPISPFGLHQALSIYDKLPDLSGAEYWFLLSYDSNSIKERKNPLVALHAFLQSELLRNNCGIVIKSHNSPPSEEKELRELCESLNYVLINDTLSHQEYNNLRSSVNCYLSPHRSEGFGLNVAEAMISKKQVVCTNYSGVCDFVDNNSCYLPNHNLVEIQEDYGPYPKGYIWAECDIESLRQQMEMAYMDFKNKNLNKCEIAYDQVMTLLSPKSVGNSLKQLLEATRNSLPTHKSFFDKYPKGYVMPYALRISSEYDSLLSRLQKVTFSIVIPVYNIEPFLLRECVYSVLNQSYPYWEICLVDDCSTSPQTRQCVESFRGLDQRIKVRLLDKNLGIGGCSNVGVEMAVGEYVCFLDNDDTIHRHALFKYAEYIDEFGFHDVLYCDEDKIGFNNELCDSYLKPDWSPEHLESCMYVLHMLTFRKSSFLELGGFDPEFSGCQDYEIVLRASRSSYTFGHIPNVLYHWRKIEGSASATLDAKQYALDNALKAIDQHAKLKYGQNASAISNPILPGTYKINTGIYSETPVTILIPTNYSVLKTDSDSKSNGFVMISNLINSIITKSTHTEYIIKVFDNGGIVPPCLANLLEQHPHKIKLHSYSGDQQNFCFSDKANQLFKLSETENVIMLNDDMEVITPSWIDELLNYSTLPEIGIVGARLLHEDNTIQHVGCVLGVHGGSAHVYHGFDSHFIGYNGFTHIVRNYSAVTGACMATRMTLFNELNGFDVNLKIDFNDTDLCLKALEAGYRNVVTPHCVMYHFESKTCIRSSQSQEERDYFFNRWRKYIQNDPYFNPSFSRRSHLFEEISSLNEISQSIEPSLQ